MKMNFNIKGGLFAIALASIVFAVGCTPEEVTGGNPLTEADLDASFTPNAGTDTIVMVGGLPKNARSYTFTAGSSEGRIQYHTWRASNELGVYANPDNTAKGGSSIKYTFTKSGTYKVEHRVVGRVGGTNSVSEQSITVVVAEEPESTEGPNLIASPNFEDPTDWTVLNINATGASWTFGNGSATISGASGHKAIYQAITVEAGKQYEFDMNVAGPGSTNTWFEVYVSPTAPTPNSDYNAGGKRIQLNTWAGCATSAFDGLLSEEQCGEADVSGNVVTFAQSGTVYFLIKCGSGDGNINSITVSDVSFHTIN